MRLTLFLCLLAPAAHAWEAGIVDGLCVLDHQEAASSGRVSYDPAQALYSIALTRDAPWDGGTTFSIRFDGAAGQTISTTRHQVDLQGRRLMVEDTGFGNVLNGLALNDTATATLGAQTMTVSLAGAAPEVDAFRACTAGQLA